MADIIERIRDRLKTRAKEYGMGRCCGSQVTQPESSRNREIGILEAIAIVDEECFRREPAQPDLASELKDTATAIMRAAAGPH